MSKKTAQAGFSHHRLHQMLWFADWMTASGGKTRDEIERFRLAWRGYTNSPLNTFGMAFTFFHQTNKIILLGKQTNRTFVWHKIRLKRRVLH